MFVLVINIEAFVLTGIDDQKSIEYLSQVTLENVKGPQLHMLYIATQTADINLKISTAIARVMRIYKKVLVTTASLCFAPGGTAANRASSAISICKEVVHCFGLPTISSETILNIVKK